MCDGAIALADVCLGFSNASFPIADKVGKSRLRIFPAVFCIRDFGAKDDGYADNVAALQTRGRFFVGFEEPHVMIC